MRRGAAEVGWGAAITPLDGAERTLVRRARFAGQTRLVLSALPVAPLSFACRAELGYKDPPMRKNRVFFPQEALDHWLSENKVELAGNELLIKSEERRYRIIEAVRVLSEVSGGEDAHEIVGKVKSVNFLLELGAELLGDSMVIGDNAYEVVPGFVGSPIGTFQEHRAESARRPRVGPARSANLPASDEELLARWLGAGQLTKDGPHRT